MVVAFWANAEVFFEFFKEEDFTTGWAFTPNITWDVEFFGFGPCGRLFFCKPIEDGHNAIWLTHGPSFEIVNQT